MQSSMANNLDLIKQKQQYDESVKKLLSEKSILAWILKECVDEFAGFSINQIMKDSFEDIEVSTIAVDQDEEDFEVSVPPQIDTSNSEDNSLKEGKIYYDIRFTAKVPNEDKSIFLIINVEEQKSNKLSYPITKRALYYCSRLISAQKNKVFVNSHYEKIRKVYSIWVQMNAAEGKANTITKYHITEKNIIGNVCEKPENYDLLTFVMIGLGKESEAKTSILRLLDVIFVSKGNPQEKKSILENDFGIPMTLSIDKEVNFMCNFSDAIYEKGIEEGRLLGIEDGKLLGIDQEKNKRIAMATEKMNELIKAGVSEELVKNIMKSLLE